MKVIFLDFDGVLNGHEWIHLESGPKIGQRQAVILNTILEKTGASVVVSSTWARKVENGVVTLDGFGWMMRTHGINAANVIGAINGQSTGQRGPQMRADQIMQWVADNKPDRWLCIDDLPVPVRHHIRPNPAVGLTPVDVQNAVRILK